MITQLTVFYTQNGISHSLKLGVDETGTIGSPYDLAEVFRVIVEASDLNPEMVIDHLKNGLEIE